MFFSRRSGVRNAVRPAIRLNIFGQAILLITQRYSEEKIMSVLNAVFQALVRALTWVFPLSESGHLGVLNDFSGRADGSVYALTGVIHIGIALGIVLAMYRLFFQLYFSA